MNQRLLIGILGGGGVGFLFGWLLHPNSPGPAAEATASRIARLEAALAAKSKQLDTLTEAATEPAPATGDLGIPPSIQPSDGTAGLEISKGMEDFRKKLLEKQKLRIDERLAALRSRLNLTDDQEASIRQILEANPDGPQNLMMLALSGEEIDEEGMLLDFLRPGRKSAEVADRIGALLTPEQQEAHAAFRQEQRTNDIEIKAGKELARLQSSLTLSPDQKDKAFAVLSALATEEYDTPVSSMAGLMAQQLDAQPDGPEAEELKRHADEIRTAAALGAQRRQQRIEAMRGILSPEQLSLYEDQQEQSTMAEMMEGFGEFPSDLFMGASGGVKTE